MKNRIWAKESIEAARLAPSAVNRQPWGFNIESDGITVFVRTSNPEFNVSKRLDCGIAMLHVEVAALNFGRKEIFTSTRHQRSISNSPLSTMNVRFQSFS
ncbi:MAG: nitroreductase family protein [Dehalococcoidales bacterium]